MTYICCVYLDSKTVDGMSSEEMAALEQASDAYHQTLLSHSAYVMARALAPAATARTIRQRGNSVQVTDGPFAETREQLAGFLLLRGIDEAEAIRIAQGMPAAAVGSVEVRAVPESD